MNILVCVTNIDTTSKINFVENDTKFDTNGVQFVINLMMNLDLLKHMDERIS